MLSETIKEEIKEQLAWCLREESLGTKTELLIIRNQKAMMEALLELGSGHA